MANFYASYPAFTASFTGTIPISGTVTANQGAPNTAANAWPVEITDGTNVAGISPASTAAMATQPAVVVGLSPNSPLPAGSNTIGSVNTLSAEEELTGSLASPTIGIVIASTNVTAYTHVGAQVAIGSGNITIDESNDGITWTSIAVRTQGNPQTLPTTNINSSGFWVGTFESVYLRVNATSNSAGNIAVILNLSSGPTFSFGATYIETVSGSVTSASQSGTWTVEPGNTANTTPWLVAGSGTAGSAATGVVTIQGIAGGTTVPVSGTVATTNLSVSATGNAVPADATYIGALNGGNLVGVVADSSSRLIVAGAGTAGSGAGGILTIQGNASGTPIPISGSITASNAAVGATGSPVPTSASYGGLLNGSNLIGALGDSSGRTIVAGAGTAGSAAGGVLTVQGIGSMTPLLVTSTSSTSSGTFQEGSIAAGSLTTSYATVVSTGGVAKIVQMRNDTDGTVLVSLNGGTTLSYTLVTGDFVSLDLAINNTSIASSTNLQAKYSGSAPTTGSIYINVTY
jgi:hypothetical protein